MTENSKRHHSQEETSQKRDAREPKDQVQDAIVNVFLELVYFQYVVDSFLWDVDNIS
jgi:hypothetical protein